MTAIVETKYGKLMGKKVESVLSGKHYFAFLGIPYAKPPVGELRFQAPQPCDKWKGVFDATFEKNECIRYEQFIQPGISGCEDCLYLNVSIPQLPGETNIPIPVMVFIHGGGFYFGTGSEKLYAADFFMDCNVILVAMNYRLHILGFLNLGLEECSGNMGLKDQVLALQWVKENIEYFGGDPDNVTIFGQSAGGSSVHFHTISPMSKGLFQKAIIQSGSVYSPWAWSYNPLDMAMEIGYKLGFRGENKYELLYFLKRQTAQDLTKVTMEKQKSVEYKYTGKCTPVLFAPSLETLTEGAFMTQYPEKLLEQTIPVPIIYGSNSKEGMIVYKTFDDDVLNNLKDDFSLILKHNFQIDPVLIPDLAEKIKRYYLGDKEIGPETTEELADLYTDIICYRFYEAIQNAVNARTPIYLYKFMYDGGLNFDRSLIRKYLHVTTNGAVHGDELSYLFHHKLVPHMATIEGNDLKVIENMTRLWSNFAKTGTPSPVVWKRYMPQEPSYLEIDCDYRTVEGTIYGERLKFLKGLLDNVATPYFVI